MEQNNKQSDAISAEEYILLRKDSVTMLIGYYERAKNNHTPPDDKIGEELVLDYDFKIQFLNFLLNSHPSETFEDIALKNENIVKSVIKKQVIRILKESYTEMLEDIVNQKLDIDSFIQKKTNNL